MVPRFTDVLNDEFTNTIRCFAEAELQYMGIPFNSLILIQTKDGVSVWRVTNENGSYVMKCFDNQSYRREISNYQILSSLDIPVLEIITYTNCSLLMEDIENSKFRLGTVDDMNDLHVVKLIASWYKTLHEKGYRFVNTHHLLGNSFQYITLYDECDNLTIENIKVIKDRTGTGRSQVWQIIEEHFIQICSAIMRLPRTITYNDFYYTNLAVARDKSSALMFDYNMLGKGYIYSDVRNVCWSLGNEEAKEAFRAAYGSFSEQEIIVDNVVGPLAALHMACRKKEFPNWADHIVDMVKNGEMLVAVEKLLEVNTL